MMSTTEDIVEVDYQRGKDAAQLPVTLCEHLQARVFGPPQRPALRGIGSRTRAMRCCSSFEADFLLLQKSGSANHTKTKAQAAGTTLGFVKKLQYLESKENVSTGGLHSSISGPDGDLEVAWSPDRQTGRK